MSQRSRAANRRLTAAIERFRREGREMEADYLERVRVAFLALPDVLQIEFLDMLQEAAHASHP